MDWQGAGRPLVLVTLRAMSLEVTTYALLDSGADGCLFHGAFAEDIGIDVYAGRPCPIEGIDARATPIMAFTHEVDLTVGQTHVGAVSVDFSYDISDDYTSQLVGRSGPFDRLRIAFRQSRKSILTARD